MTDKQVDWKQLAEERFAEIERARGIIEQLKLEREARLTKPLPTEDEIAEDFYIEFQTVCQRERDDTLPYDVARWVIKWCQKVSTP